MNISLPAASSQNPNNFKSQCFLVNLSTGKASKKLFLRWGENIHNGEELGNTNCCSVMIQPRSRYNESSEAVVWFPTHMRKPEAGNLGCILPMHQNQHTKHTHACTQNRREAKPGRQTQNERLHQEDWGSMKLPLVLFEGRFIFWFGLCHSHQSVCFSIICSYDLKQWCILLVKVENNA